MSTFHDFSIKTIDGQDRKLDAYQGKAVLVVNVASQCGLTPQYAGLEKLWQEHQAKDFVILGLPCNQFGAQEPGTENEIKAFCETQYSVSFPLGAKLEVNGAKRHPLYAWLTGETGGADIKWNFEKFLIDKDGRIAQRFAPTVTPEDPGLRSAVAAALK